MELTVLSMHFFDKDNLNYHYKWEDESVSTTIVRKKTLDRTRGTEMLQFINEFFKTHNLSSASSFKRAEYLLYNHLPINIKNKSEITSWLLKHWDREFYGR